MICPAHLQDLKTGDRIRVVGAEYAAMNGRTGAVYWHNRDPFAAYPILAVLDGASQPQFFYLHYYEIEKETGNEA